MFIENIWVLKIIFFIFILTTATKIICADTEFVHFNVFASSKYLVTGTFSQDAPQLHCNCKSFFHFRECSHVVAAVTLENLFNLQDKISSIARGKMRGRPKNYNPVGFAAHSLNPTQLDSTIQMARNTVGGTVARIKDQCWNNNGL